MRERTIDIGEGLELAAFEAGAGGRPLLLVHGFTGAKDDFADHVDALAEAGWWTVAPDLRGHGSSSKPHHEQAYSLAGYADDILGLIDALGWSRLVLLGHSMGGMAAQIAALARPQALDGLVLMDTTHGPITNLDRELAAVGQDLARQGGMPAVKAVLDDLGDDAPLGTPAQQRLFREREGYRELCDRKFLSCAPAMYAAMLFQMLDQDDRLDALAQLELATLVMVGEQDEPFLEPSACMAEAIPGARHVVIADAGHSPQFENPPAWREVLLGFLDDL